MTRLFYVLYFVYFISMFPLVLVGTYVRTKIGTYHTRLDWKTDLEWLLNGKELMSGTLPHVLMYDILTSPLDNIKIVKGRTIDRLLDAQLV